MFHIFIIKDGDVNKVAKRILVDGQMYVDEKPVKGSANLITSNSVAELVGLLPVGTDEENPLVNQKDLADTIAAADLSGVPAEVAAAALCQLKENLDAATIENADLEARVSALENAESVNDNRAILSAPSIRNDVQEDDGIGRTLDEVPELVKKETIDADEGDETETEK